MTVTEAGACGTPSVVTRISGHQDAVVDGTIGPPGRRPGRAGRRRWTPSCATRCCRKRLGIGRPGARRPVHLGRHRPGDAGRPGRRVARRRGRAARRREPARALAPRPETRSAASRSTCGAGGFLTGPGPGQVGRVDRSHAAAPAAEHGPTGTLGRPAEARLDARRLMISTTASAPRKTTAAQARLLAAPKYVRPATADGGVPGATARRPCRPRPRSPGRWPPSRARTAPGARAGPPGWPRRPPSPASGRAMRPPHQPGDNRRAEGHRHRARGPPGAERGPEPGAGTSPAHARRSPVRPDRRSGPTDRPGRPARAQPRG